MGDMPGMPGMGHALPPLTLGRALALDPSADWPFVVGCVLMLGLYLAGVVRLRRRGDLVGITSPIATDTPGSRDGSLRHRLMCRSAGLGTPDDIAKPVVSLPAVFHPH